MSTLSFDDSFAFFDITPVFNVFLSDYMPDAPGDYVKVYLYGLFRCYHQKADLTIEDIAGDVKLTPAMVEKAFQYWERCHLVWRTQDKPPEYQFILPIKKYIGADSPMEDNEYARFVRHICDAVPGGKWSTTSALSRVWEWHTDEKMELSVEVLTELVRHMTKNGEKPLPIAAAEKNAVALADFHAETSQDVEQFFSIEDSVRNGSRELLRKLGQNRNPSMPEMDLYRKWNIEWGMTGDAILAAADSTVSGKPSFAYMDGIIKGMRAKDATIKTEQDVNEYRALDSMEREGLKSLLRVFSDTDTDINKDRADIYREMRQLYSDDIIMLAARGCSKYSDQKNLTDVLNTLRVWKRQNVLTLADANKSLAETAQLYHLSQLVMDAAEQDGKPNKSVRTLVSQMKGKYGFSDDMILHCASLAKGKNSIVPYMRKIMEDAYARGIKTPEEMEKARAAYTVKSGRKTGVKTVQEQNYTQRDYSDMVGLPKWAEEKLNKKPEENKNAE